MQLTLGEGLFIGNGIAHCTHQQS